MPTSTWPCPAGVFFVQVECYGAGAAGHSQTPQPYTGGGGGGAYARRRVPVIPAVVYDIEWGDGVASVGGPTSKFSPPLSSPLVQANPGALGTGGTPQPVPSQADVSYAGGDGGPELFIGADGVGAGGGGGAGRNGPGGNGANGNTTGDAGAGGSNSPSTSTGNGGRGGAAGGNPGGNGNAPSGGGGGMGTKNVLGPDLSGIGSPGSVIIYDDTDAHGFDPFRATIGSFGSAPTPPVNVKARKSARFT